MIESATRDRITRAYTALRQAGLRNRPAQRQMVAALAHALTQEQPGGLTLIEAPTGTGKTLAYLLAGIEAARQTKRQLIVSTATLALQEQILHHDIPRLAQAIGEPIRAVIAKSRRWYVCDRNLLAAGHGDAGQQGLWESDAAAQPLAREDAATVDAMGQARAAGTWDGDLSGWPEPVPESVRRVVTTGPGGCPGRRCPHANTCPALRSRTALGGADILVTNHAYLLADQLSPNDSSLADPSKAIVVFDEGHNLPRAALQATTVRVVLARLPALWEATLATVRAAQALAQSASAAGVLADCARLQADTQAWAMAVGQWAVGETSRLLTPQEIGECAAPCAAMTSTVQQVEAGLAQIAGVLAKETEGAAARALAAGQLLDRLARHQETLHGLAALSAALLDDSIHLARWLERDATGAITLACARLDTTDTLRTLLSSLGASAVVSATLRKLGSFAPLEAELGGRAHTTLALPSAFDLAAQGELRVATKGPPPSDAAAHTAALVGAILDHHAPGEGTLVLFTSHRQLREVASHLSGRLHAAIRTQGEADLAGTLAAHAADVQAGRTAILMGVATFAEGLDLPGALCRALIIAKLPFACPDEPIERARMQECEARGDNAFAALSLPHAHLRLTQAMGRLIRTESDHGWVVVADTRLATTRYGRQLLEHLPPFRRTSITLTPVALDAAASTRKGAPKRAFYRRTKAATEGDTTPHGRHDSHAPSQSPRPPSRGKRKPATRDLFIGYATTGRGRLVR